jgi:hypothetical protein
MDVFKFIEQCTETLILFSLTPYVSKNIDDLLVLSKKKLLNENGCSVLEHTPRNDYKNFPL